MLWFISTPVRPSLCLTGLADRKYYSLLLLMSSFFVYTASLSCTRVSHWRWITMANPWSFDWTQERVWQKRETQNHTTERHTADRVILSCMQWCCQFPLIGWMAASLSGARQPTLPGKKCSRLHPRRHIMTGISRLYISIGLHHPEKLVPAWRLSDTLG